MANQINNPKYIVTLKNIQSANNIPFPDGNYMFIDNLLEYIWRIDNIFYKTIAISKNTAIDEIINLLKSNNYSKTYIEWVDIYLRTTDPIVKKITTTTTINCNEYIKCVNWIIQRKNKTDLDEKDKLFMNTVNLMNQIITNEKQFPIWFYQLFDLCPELTDVIKLES